MNFREVAKHYSWQRPYEAAILETNNALLMNRIVCAFAALNSRLSDLQKGHAATRQEKMALIDAVSRLRALYKGTVEN